MLTPKKRVIPIPKTDGFLPLIPLFVDLSALGGGAAGIAKAVNDVKAAKAKLEKSKRHNQMIDSIAIGKKWGGLYLKPYKTGRGLYLKSYLKNC